MGKPFQTKQGGKKQVFESDIQVQMDDREFEFIGQKDCRDLVVVLNPAKIHQYREKISRCSPKATSVDSPRVAFDSSLGASIRHSALSLWSRLGKECGTGLSELEIRELEGDLLTQFVLATEALVDSEIGKSGRVSGNRCVVALAEDYLCSRLSKPVSRADLASATNTSIRTLSRQFQKEKGMGPMAFLRQRRMDAVYAELLGFDSTEASVGEIVSKYGFTQMGAFASDYRRRFGELPSQTLRH